MIKNYLLVTLRNLLKNKIFTLNNIAGLGITTILSLIEMYNLVSLDIIRRTKEIGIRKIQGAPVPLIMFLVSRKFLIVLVIASLLGTAA